VTKNLNHKIVLAILFTIGLVTAWNSSGFYHVDEHFQILEFSGLKMGINKVSDLAWEYNAQIRPALQVFIAYAVFSTSDLLGIGSPFIKTFFLRFITLLF
jgi:GPI mannosyltransferase 3